MTDDKVTEMVDDFVRDVSDTVILPDQVALIMNPDGTLDLYLPKTIDLMSDVPMPDYAAVLTAIAFRLGNDPGFESEMLEYMTTTIKKTMEGDPNEEVSKPVIANDTTN